MTKLSSAPADAKSNGVTSDRERRLSREQEAREKGRTKLGEEAAAIESKITEHIRNGELDILCPNTGTSVEIKGSRVCIDYHDEVGYRVWEWHGHCIMYQDGGYTPEYIYGNYFEPLILEPNLSVPMGGGGGPVGLSLLNRRPPVAPGLGGLLTTGGAIPMRSILDEAYRRASSK